MSRADVAVALGLSPASDKDAVLAAIREARAEAARPSVDVKEELRVADVAVAFQSGGVVDRSTGEFIATGIDALVDWESARLHVRACDLLKSRGVIAPSDFEYADALAAVTAAGQATTEPPETVTPGELLQLHRNPTVHSLALTIAREGHAHDTSSSGMLSQSQYDEFCRQAEKRLAGGSRL
jgi:hypothetical protein